ncbi:Mu-like prophage major head subunit gpT family protein [Helicobacter suis]|uniref:Mu-like prophage major head subunit gpT family protein n=1 Tax=Helicobacter suis TaxID=104628 RepID=UPI0006810080|nr:Mu-like prophage major head subunit gpT family protein [Helicobacter suis]
MLESRTAMMCYTNEDGRPLNIVPNLLVIPPSLESAAMQLLKAPTLANGAANICYNLMEYLVCPYLNADRWILLDTTKTIKPIILQTNKLVEFSALDQPTNQNNFMRREFLYGIDSEDNTGYGLWQLAYCNELPNKTKEAK